MRQAVAGTLLGSPGFVARMRSWLRDRLPDRDVPAARALRRSVGVDAIEAAVCATFGVPRESLHVRRRKGNVARAAALYLCRKLTGEALGALGERFGQVSEQAVEVVAKIPGEIMEAAEVDGIPGWKRFWSITLPLLKPAIGVAVLGTQYTQALRVDRVGLACAVAMGCLSSAVLVANNLRDIPTDAQSGKITLAVRLGDRRTRALYLVLLAVAGVLTLALAAATPWCLAGLLAAPLAIRAAGPVRSGSLGPQLIPVLRDTGLTMLVWAVAVAAALALGS